MIKLLIPLLFQIIPKMEEVERFLTQPAINPPVAPFRLRCGLILGFNGECRSFPNRSPAARIYAKKAMLSPLLSLLITFANAQDNLVHQGSFERSGLATRQ